MRIKIQRKVEMWVRETYDIKDESEIQNAIDYDILPFDSEVLWETQEDLGPVEVYDSKWNVIYSNNNDN